MCVLHACPNNLCLFFGPWSLLMVCLLFFFSFCASNCVFFFCCLRVPPECKWTSALLLFFINFALSLSLFRIFHDRFLHHRMSAEYYTAELSTYICIYHSLSLILWKKQNNNKKKLAECFLDFHLCGLSVYFECTRSVHTNKQTSPFFHDTSFWTVNLCRISFEFSAETENRPSMSQVAQ